MRYCSDSECVLRQPIGCKCSTALQLAVSRLDVKFVTTLLAHGADPNIQGENALDLIGIIPDAQYPRSTHGSVFDDV